MKLRTYRRITRPSPASVVAPIGQLVWSDGGVDFRVTAWPEATFERRPGDTWQPFEPEADTFAAAAVALTAPAWRRFLEFVPAEEKRFLELFGFGRLEALWVLTRCAPLWNELVATPAFTAFIAAHAALRGTSGPRWCELRAVQERGGVFAVLEWLGLPAARETLSALRNVVDPDVPRRLLAPLRSSLWRPGAVSALQRTPVHSDRQLAQFCHALAA